MSTGDRDAAAELDDATRVVHAGREANPSRALSMPIYQTSTFRFDSATEGAAMSVATAPTELYTRCGNPTTRALEEAYAELEGGEAALAFASGMAAASAAVMATITPSAHVVAAGSLYSGTLELLERVLRPFGVDTSFVDSGDLAAWEAALRDDTRLVIVETPANPTLAITDLAAVAELAHRRGAFVLADNTWASPWNTRPLEQGCDGVFHSATKYLGGHSDVIAGAVVGRREWIDEVWRMLTIFGGCPSPHDSWLVYRGLKTLPLRVEQQNASAQALAEALREHPAIERVHYPGLPDHPGHAVARRQMRGFGGMLAFDLRGGLAAGCHLLESLRLVIHAVSLGGPETLAVHPASTTHSGLSADERRRAGIGDGLVRVSVGLESPRDLIADFRQALDRIP